MGLVTRVLVVGGGIGGMSAGIALRKLGAEVDLVEIDPAWNVYGAGITITGASLRAFQALGVLEQIRRDGHVRGGVRIHGQDGTLIAEQAPQTDELIHSGGGIMRPALHAILATATRAAGVRVRLGVTVEGLTQSPDRVSVTLTDGSREQYDLVVAADGIFSKLRRMLFSDAPSPELTGQGCWRLVAPRPESVTCASMFVGGPYPVGFVPVSATSMYMFLLQPIPSNPMISAEECPALLRALLAPFGGFAAEVREGIQPGAPIVYRPLEVLLMRGPWHQGRVVLLGDAAHATTPHLATGAGMAVEDALVLAEELAAAQSVEAALERHTARRSPRCRAAVEGSVAVGKAQLAGLPPSEVFGLMRTVGSVLPQPY